MKKNKFFFLTIFILFTFFLTTFAQESERTIKRKIWDKEPIEIQTVRIKGTSVNFNQNFLYGNAWFDGLTISVKNVSNKTVVFIDLALIFPPSGEASRASDHMLYGQYPLPPGETDDAPPIEKQPPLQPVETATLTLDDYAGTRDYLNDVGQPQSIKELEIEISEVIFSDGTKWSGGLMMRRDPNAPNKWVPEQNSSGVTEKPVTLIKTFYEKNNFLSFFKPLESYPQVVTVGLQSPVKFRRCFL